jgi:hypothetical protein
VPRTDVDRSHTDDIERLAQTTFLQELVTSVEAACGATLHTQVDSPT